jgi:transposase
MERKAYPSDISDEEWALVAPYLTLMTEDAPQRDFPLREVFNGLRYIVKTGAPWRWMPHDLPPWQVVYQLSLAQAIEAGAMMRVYFLDLPVAGLYERLTIRMLDELIASLMGEDGSSNGTGGDSVDRSHRVLQRKQFQEEQRLKRRGS